MKIENIKLKDLKHYIKNSKQHPEEQIKTIARSIQEYGFNTPILIDSDNNVIAGHGRLLAAEKLKMNQIPCIRVKDLTPDQIKAYRIMDNKSSESEWQEELLVEELKELMEEDHEMQMTGYNTDEINELLDLIAKETKKDKVKEVDKISQMLVTCPFCKKEFKKLKN